MCALECDGARAVLVAFHPHVDDFAAPPPPPVAAVGERVDGDVQILVLADIGAQKLDNPVITAQNNIGLPGVVKQFLGIHRHLGGDGADVVHILVPQAHQRPGARFLVDYAAPRIEVGVCGARGFHRVGWASDPDLRWRQGMHLRPRHLVVLRHDARHRAVRVAVRDPDVRNGSRRNRVVE